MQKTLPLILALVVIAAGIAFGVPLDASAADMAPQMLLLGQVAGAAAVGAGVARQDVPFRRIREDLPAFENVVTTGRATTEIPRYALSLLRVTLKLGGTALTNAMLTEIRLRHGAKVLWFATGSHLDLINKYKGLYDNAGFLTVDFTQPRNKEMGGEFIGGIDMASLPEGKLYLEVFITGATAPTLSAKATWGAPQGNTLLQKLLQFTWGSGSGTGKFKLPLDFRGARVQRLYAIYTGTDWANTATSAAFAGNTGNGAMGAVTVSAGAKVGVHKFICIEPGANVGTFAHYDPDGILVSSRMIVASAYSGGGLAFTLADGGTDFIAGDGFNITVSSVTNGNLSRIEVKKNSRVVWDYECAEARFVQQEYERAPQSLMYVADFILDNHSDGILLTADASLLEINAWLTAADNLTLYAECLDTPENN